MTSIADLIYGTNSDRMIIKAGWQPSTNAYPTTSTDGFVYIAEDSGTVSGNLYSAGDAIIYGNGSWNRLGRPGADGDITWQGTWVSQNYTINQAVYYNGSSYVCKLNTVSSEVPTDTTYWDVLASKGNDALITSGTNSNGYWLKLYKPDNTLMMVVQYKFKGLLSSTSQTIAWPTSFPDTNYVAVGSGVDSGRIITFGEVSYDGNKSTSSITIKVNTSGVYANWQGTWVSGA